MKKLLLLLTLLCTVFSTVFADVVTIGDDASTSYSLYLPLRSYYNYSYSQQIVYADEIGTAGTISSLSLNMKSDAGSTTRSIEIYMLEVDKDEFASASDWVAVSADDLVYSGQIALTATAEDFVFDLDNPFSYGGSDNLLIVFRDVTGSFSGSYSTGAQALVSGSSTDPYLALYANRDTPGAYDITNPNVTGTRLSQRNVITLDIEASSGPTCKKPSLLEVSDISENEATLSWDGEAGFFTVEYKAASSEIWIPVVESSPLLTATISELQSNTAYEARVIGICGEQVSGERTISFRTACGVYSVATSGAYEDDFESYPATAAATNNGTSFGCWETGSSTGTYIPHVANSGSFGYYPQSGSKCLSFYGSGYCYAALPIFADELNTLRISFWVKMESTSSGVLTLGYLTSTDPGDWSSYQVLTTYTSVSSLTQYETYLDTIPAEAARLVFRWYYSGQYSCAIDDIKVSRIPTCLKPANLAVVPGSVAKNSIQLGWEDTTPAAAWKIQYKKSSAANWTTLDADANPFEISGLEAFTTYNVRVAAVCDPEDAVDGTSDYSDPINFKTAAGVPFYESFNHYSMSEGWNRGIGLWDVVSAEPDSLLPTTSGWATSSSLNGVFPDSTYHLKLNIFGTNCRYWLISPAIELDANQQLTFDMALTKSSGTLSPVEAGQQNDDKFIVLLTADGGLSWEELYVRDNVSSADAFDQIACSANGEFVSIDLSSYASEKIQIAFYGESTEEGGDNYLHIANVSIDAIPICDKPLELAVSDITAQTANFTWGAASANSWILQYSRNADFSDSVEVAVDEASYSAIGLTPETKYYVRVKAVCDGDAQSAWSASISFVPSDAKTITLYDGTGTNGYVPVYGYYCDNLTRSQFIMPAANVAELQWDTITRLTFYASNANISWGNATFEVYMAETQETEFVGEADYDAMTKVFNAASLAIVDNEMVVNLDVPFVYQGDGNLMIAFKQIVTGSYTSCTWIGEAQTYHSAIGGYEGYMYFIDFLPKTTFRCLEGEEPACMRPANLAVAPDGIGLNSILLTWENRSSESNWVLQYKKHADQEWISLDQPVTANPFNLEGLDAASVYDIRVAAWCDPADSATVSDFTDPITVATACETVAQYPWSENFEGVAVASVGQTMPVCWNVINTTTSGFQIYPTVKSNNTKAHSGENYLYFLSQYSSSTDYDPQDQYAILPEMENINTLRIKFWARMEDATDEELTLSIGVMTDPADVSTFVPVAAKSPATTAFEQFVIPFDTYAGTGKYIAIKINAAEESYRCAILDDIAVEEIPSCMNPDSLQVALTEGDGTVASLSWAAGASETAWVLQYSKNLDFSDSIEVAVNDLPAAALENLTPEATYYARVKAVCGVGEESPWTDPISFIPTNAQSIAVINGRTTNNSQVPVYGNWTDDKSYSQFIIPADSLAAIQWGTIKGLTFYANNANKAWGAAKFEVYVSSADAASFASSALYPWTDMTKVMNEASLSIVDSLMIITFDAPYQYEGGNLMIGVRQTVSGQYSDCSWAGVTVPNASLGGYGTSISRFSFLPKLSVHFVPGEAPACLKPTGLAISHITDNAAMATWDDIEDGAWKYAYALASEQMPAEFIAIANDTVEISGLVQNSDYIFYLRQDCGEDGLSEIISKPFHTRQTPVAVPFADDFENGNNWLLVNGEVENAWVVDTAAHNGAGNHALYISNDNGLHNTYTNSKAALVYAAKALSFEQGSYIFRYEWRANGESSSDYLRVALVPDSIDFEAGYISSTSLPTGWTALDGGSKLNLKSAWDTIISQEITVANGIYNVVLVWRNDGSLGSNPPAAVDNFSITEVACPIQSNLVIPDSTITDSSAKIFWTKGNAEQDAWQIAFDTIARFVPDSTDSITILDVTSIPYELTGLVANKTYYVSVRAKCGDTEFSQWLPRKSFKTAKSCQTPSGLAASQISDTSAVISWNTFGQSDFNLRYGIGSNWLDTIENVATPFVLNGLEANTSYRVQVQVPCDPTKWSSTLNLKTACEPISALPWDEDFEAMTASTVPDCWDNSASSTSTATSTPAYVWGVFGTNDKMLRMYNYYVQSGSALINTPHIELPAAPASEVSFDYANLANCGPFSLKISADGGANWTELQAFENKTGATSTSTPSSLDEAIIDLSAYAGQSIMLQFYAEANYSSGAIFVDNISIHAIPSCKKTSAPAIDSIAAHSALISWTLTDTLQTAWQIAYDTVARFVPDSAEQITIIDVDTISYLLNGLDAEKTYYIAVRANCGEDDYSIWSSVKSFTTGIACHIPDSLAAILTPGDGSIATLNWAAGDANAWVLQYSKNANFSDSIEIEINDAPAAALTALIPETKYYARVKAVCGGIDGESRWSAAISFVPTDAYFITLNDSTATNDYIPVYGLYVDDLTRSQFIIPESDLEAIQWDSITQLAFYASQESVDWGAAQFEVYLAESPTTTLSALAEWSALTKVKNAGSLSIADGKMIVTLDAPYQYQGGNLLIGFNQTVAGTYKSATWYGKNVQGASYGGYESSSTVAIAQRNFLPKLTIHYVQGEMPACDAPTELSASDIYENAATISWNSDAIAGQLVYSESADFNPNDVTPIEVEKPYVLGNLLPQTTYYYYVRTNCGHGNLSAWSAKGSFTTSVPCETKYGEILYDSLCLGGSYTWNEVVYTEPGTYYDTLLTAAHCDSILTLHLAYYGAEDTIYAQSIVAANELPFTYEDDEHPYIEGQAAISYPAGTPLGEYQDTVLVVGEHCTAVLIHTLTIMKCEVEGETLEVELCPGEGYTWKGQIIGEAGTYYDTIPSVAGCDSIETLILSYYDPEDTIFVRLTIDKDSLPFTYVNEEHPYITGEAAISYPAGTAIGLYSDTAYVEGEHCTAVLVLNLKIEDAQGIGNIFGQDGKNVHKVLYRDILYIVINDEWYSAEGKKVADPRE